YSLLRIERTEFPGNMGIVDGTVLGRNRNDTGAAVGTIDGRLRPAQNFDPLDDAGIDLPDQIADLSRARFVDLHAIANDQNAGRKAAQLDLIELAGRAALLEFEAGLAA